MQTNITYNTPDGEVRVWECPDCGHRWLEFCDSDQYPNHCPECNRPLRDNTPADDNGEGLIFVLTLGDYHGDGHCHYTEYILRTNATMEQIHKAYFNIEHETGVDIEELFDEKEYLTRAEYDLLRDLGWDIELTWEREMFHVRNEADGKSPITIDELENLWEFLIRKVDPSIRFEQVDYPNFHELSDREKKMHASIFNIGYAIESDNW